MAENETTSSVKNNSQFILKDAITQEVSDIIIKRRDTFNPKRREQLNESKANIAYLMGKQNIQLIGDTIAPLDQERSTDVVANILLPAVQKDVAVAISTPPVFDIVPAGTDDDDKATAIVAQKMFKYIQRKIGRDMKRAETVLWYDIAGIGWRKVYWNPYHTVVGINPAPVNPESGQPNPRHIPELPVGAAICQGEVQIDIIPPNQLIYDYRESDLSKLEWIIHCKRVSAAWVVDRFGPEVYRKLQSKFSGGEAGGESQFEATIMMQFANAFGGNGDQQRVSTSPMSSGTAMQLDSDKLIDYYEYWQKPTKTLPAGMLAVMLGDQVVVHGPYPTQMYPHGELPFIPVAPLAIAQATMGAISRISQARPLQREYNRLKSQIGENLDVMGNAVIFSPRSAKLRHRTLDNGAGNIIEYDGPVGRPTREAGVPMNGQVFAYLNEVKQAVEGIFAFHGPSYGVAPAGLESGKGLELLQGADIKQLGPIVSEFETADERVVYQALTIGTANYEDGRMLNIVGNDFKWSLYTIDKEQLRGKFNVIVKQHSSMPVDKDTEAAKMFSVWQSGLYGDPSDPELRIWTIEQMQMGNADNILQKHSKQKNFAMMEFVSIVENLKSLQLPEGASEQFIADQINSALFTPMPNPWDDHLVHIKTHNDFMMDNFWKFRATGNPLYMELLNGLQQHIGIHQQIIARQQQQQFEQNLQAQMMIRGTTPGQIVLSQVNNKKQDSNKENK